MSEKTVKKDPVAGQKSNSQTAIQHLDDNLNKNKKG